jgi:hypothetical protein
MVRSAKVSEMSDDYMHFDDEAWVRFALGLVPVNLAARMRAHLEQGCAECAETCRLWTLVVKTAESEQLYEPPRDAVDAAKAAFPLARRLSLLPHLAQSAQLIFDSFRAPLPAGVRGNKTEARHLLYDADDFLIDLRLENEGEGRIALCGQILPKRSVEAQSLEVGILVTAESGRLLRHTLANALGEFQMELEGRGPLALYMQVPGSDVRHIELPSKEDLNAAHSSQ